MNLLIKNTRADPKYILCMPAGYVYSKRYLLAQ